ncbi:MAG: T9SS type A sorting domain-containing protein [Candidatus Cloacimonetes bacterium]|nr:T9SS type A sorting domain-containing protein [Candidatus Cloacimonadota bacterium]
MSYLRITFFALAFLLCSSVLLAQFSGGSGTEEDPYQVATADELNNVRNYPTAHFIQTADLDLYVPPYSNALGWEPICTTDPFSGVYDGNGFKILYMYINNTTQPTLGLFGKIQNAQLRDITLQGFFILCDYAAGALVGISESSLILSCTVRGEISGLGQDIGGIAGRLLSGSTMQDCLAIVTLEGENYCGLLTGWANYSSIENCDAYGSVWGWDGLGGLVGDLVSTPLQECHAEVEITGHSAIGGLAGSAKISSVISNCSARCRLTGTAAIGGLVGSLVTGAQIVNCYSASEFVCDGTIGGIAGFLNDGQITASYWNSDLVQNTVNPYGEARTTVQMTYPYDANTYVGWDFAEIWHHDTDHSINSGYPFLDYPWVSIPSDAVPALSFRLNCYPNPFKINTNFEFELAKGGVPEFGIYNLKGQLVKKYSGSYFPAGKSTLTWNGLSDSGTKLASGIYFLRMNVSGKTLTQKLILMK